MKVTLADQITAVQAALDGRIMADELAAVIKTLEYVAANEDGIRVVHRIKNDPAMKAVFDAFQGAKLVDIKPL